MVDNEVVNNIVSRCLISANQHIVIGLSGGPDSVCLFHVLLKISGEWNLTIHPVHVNHQIRPEGAVHDQNYVQRITAENGLDCRVVTFDCEKMAAETGMTSEEAGRKMRYQAFDEEASRIEASGVPADCIRIVTAHNADDQAETILLRLIRGTGTSGLAGIDWERRSEKGYRIVRPLLSVRKKDVLDYCRSHGLDPCFDETNNKPLYARNRIRLELLPYLEKYNPSIRQSLLRLGDIAAEEKAFLDETAEKALAEARRDSGAGSDVRLDCRALLAQPDAVRHRAVLMALKESGLTEDAGYEHLQLIDSVLRSERPSASADLPRGFRVIREYENIRICSGRQEHDSGVVSIHVKVVPRESFSPGDYNKGLTAYFDAEALEERFGADFREHMTFRTRMPGDYLPLKKGRKKIQDLLVDERIPRGARDCVRLFACGSEVLWIPEGGSQGLAGVLKHGKYSPRYPVSEGTKLVFIVEISTGA